MEKFRRPAVLRVRSPLSGTYLEQSKQQRFR